MGNRLWPSMYALQCLTGTVDKEEKLIVWKSSSLTVDACYQPSLAYCTIGFLQFCWDTRAKEFTLKICSMFLGLFTYCTRDCIGF